MLGLARGEEKELVSKFCQDVTLFNPHMTELAARGQDEPPDTGAECSHSQERVGPVWLQRKQRGCARGSRSSPMAHPLTQECFLSLPRLGGRSRFAQGNHAYLRSSPSPARSVATKYPPGPDPGQPGVRGPHPRANARLGVTERIKLRGDVMCAPQRAWKCLWTSGRNQRSACQSTSPPWCLTGPENDYQMAGASRPVRSD